MEDFFKPSVCLGHISQNLAQNYQRKLSIDTSKVVLFVLEAKKILTYQLLEFSKFSSNGNCQQWVFSDLESILLIPTFPGFRFIHKAYSKKSGKNGELS